MDITYELATEEYGEVIISKDAYACMKERNGWIHRAAYRMAIRVYREGLRPNQVKGISQGMDQN